ncbi:MAG: DUF6600 domain-containing protein [Terracidiphilus sp.]|jgi:hypothetical protein
MSYILHLSSARKTLMAAGCAALIALSPLLSSAQNDPPPEAGRVSAIEGAASVQPAGLDNWGQAEINMPLGPGDRIYTDDSSRAEIQIGRTYIRMGTGTDISIISVSQAGVSIGVAQGRIHLHCFGLWPGQTLNVNTPSGTTSINSPGELRVDVFPDQQAALFTQYLNNGFITGASGFSSQLPAGSSLELIGSNPVVPQWLQMAAPEPVDEWSQQRDAQITASISYRYVSSDIGGAYDLDANGDWTPQSPYGAIWFPRVDAGWAPYHNGHWVSHAPWGWVWVEKESWGYAPFHYGRWVVFNGRWGWVPGPQAAHPVWSPALVVFAGGINIGGGGVSAWFPLGPGEPYRPWYPCSPAYIDQVNITNLRPAPGIRIQASYAGFNFNAVVFANRSVGISAMNQQDFAAGRPVSVSNVVINKTIINNITIINQPPVEPNPRSFASRAPAGAPAVAAERPAFINEKGMTVSAKAGFKPAPPPVRPAPPVQALAGHKVAAAPPGVKITAPSTAAAAPEKPAQQAPTKVTPAGKPAVSGAGNPNPGAPNPGGQGPHPNSARPSELTAKPATNQPATGTANAPGAKPATNPTDKPAPKPAGQPGAKPATNPPAKAADAKPGEKPKPGAKPENNDKDDKDAPKKDNPDDKNN